MRLVVATVEFRNRRCGLERRRLLVPMQHRLQCGKATMQGFQSDRRGGLGLLETGSAGFAARRRPKIPDDLAFLLRQAGWQLWGEPFVELAENLNHRVGQRLIALCASLATSGRGGS